MPAYARPVSKDKVDIVAILHNNLNQFLKLVLVLGEHDILAIIHNDENLFLLDFLHYSLCVFPKSFI